MSDRKAIQTTRKTTNVIAASGRLRNDHFLLTADHLLLEVDQASFELVSAMAEGNIQIHMVTPDPDGEFVLYAKSAVFQPQRQRLSLTGWQGTRENGVDIPPSQSHRDVVVPTDGSFLLPMMPEQAEKRLPIKHTLRAAA